MPKFRPLHRLTFLALVLVFALGLTASQAASLRLIAVNDFHGHLEPGSNTLMLPDPDNPGQLLRVQTGGAAWLAGLIGQLRREVPDSVVFASGDTIGAAPMISTLFRHESTIAVMNRIGLDFAIVGNHEFDAGQDELRRIAMGGCGANSANGAVTSCEAGPYAGANFPFLAANVEGPDGQTIFRPLLIKEYDGVRVGFIGVVTRTAPEIVSPAGIKGLKFLDEAGTLNRYAAELKRHGVNTIVAVVHEGGRVATDWNDTSCKGREGEIFKIADKLSAGIDLVFSAHTHQGYNCIIDTPAQKGLHVIQATSYGRAVAVIDVEFDAAGRIDRSKTVSRNVPVVSQAQGNIAAVPSDPAIAGLVAKYAALTAPKADRVIGSIAGPVGFTSAGQTGTPADFPSGRMAADAQLEATQGEPGKAQIALTNPGGVRSALPCAGAPPCPVTFGQVFTMQPFGNALEVMTLTGAQLNALLEDQQQPGAAAPRFLQPSHGLTYSWKRSAPYGQRVTDLKLGGAAVQSEAQYRVTVNDFLADGGDGFRRFLEGTERTGGPVDSDALVDFLGAHQPYAADPASRITVTD
jgi:5'-nucleotidase